MNDGYYYFSDPFIYNRGNLKTIETGNVFGFEVFTPLAQGSDMNNPVIDKNGYAWKNNMSLFTMQDENILISKNILNSSQARYFHFLHNLNWAILSYFV